MQKNLNQIRESGIIMAKKVSRDAVKKINSYKSYFEDEMGQLSSQLKEFKANKEEFYRRWSQYNDFHQVEQLLQ